MLPYSSLGEKEQWKVSHRTLRVRFTDAVSKQNPLNRENFALFFLDPFLLFQQDWI